MTAAEDRPPPDWLGDVTSGVDVWTRGAAHPDPAAGAPPPDPVADGPDADPQSVARTILLDQLTGRARSRKELSDKLAKKRDEGRAGWDNPLQCNVSDLATALIAHVKKGEIVAQAKSLFGLVRRRWVFRAGASVR